MAQANKVYDFKSVGETVQQFNDKLEVVRDTPSLGIKSPISFSNKSNSVFDMHTDPAELVKDNLRNLILTNHGERLMLPSFGANLKELLMELGHEDADTVIMSNISNAVSNWMPFVSLTGYEPVRKVGESGNVNKLAMRITFSIPLMARDNLALDIILYEAG